MQCKIGVIVLAAGLSTRMGQQKLLLPLGTQSVLGHVLATVKTLNWHDCIAVIGEPCEQLAELCSQFGTPYVFNPDRAQGQASSLRLGLKHVSMDVDGILFILGDQPLISPAFLQALLRAFNERGNRKAIIVPKYEGQMCSPVLFGADWRNELEILDGDQGGRVLLRKHPEWISFLEWDSPTVYYDVDTPEAYQILLQTLNKDII